MFALLLQIVGLDNVQQIVAQDNYSANCDNMCASSVGQFFANFANCGSRNFFLQIIQISIQESLFANFVNCRRALDILFLQVVQLVVLDILLTNFCELLFKTMFCSKKIWVWVIE